jgi:golgi resident protein GCP60
LTFESVIVILIDEMNDRYDIGFGLFFEWSKSPTEQVSVHISDSEEEDEEDEHDNG